MPIAIINPSSGLELKPSGDGWLRDEKGGGYPVVNGIPRVCEPINYTENFGKQWNAFRATQMDRPEHGLKLSERRFFQATGWTPEEMAGQDVLEVGSGAGRFSRVVLQRTKANLWSIDYSTAVEANLANNGEISGDRFHLFQASVYEMPFPASSFDKVFCMGVLQHTPDFEASVRALIRKAKPGGEIVVDFYPIKGWWTKIHAKYLLRPITRRMPHDRLLRLIEKNADRLIAASLFLDKVGLHVLTRFLPVCDIRGTLPRGLSEKELREWVVLDTFDQYSPEYDNPQRVKAVARMFERAGATVTYADIMTLDDGFTSAVVRGTKNPQ
ncbi:MAG TPA: class I SAM-dependent methyltransferase [Allosphingosinicella sp.]|jgi:SAM-dependent methyltransferase